VEEEAEERDERREEAGGGREIEAVMGKGVEWWTVGVSSVPHFRSCSDFLTALRSRDRALLDPYVLFDAGC
jgi:hypothetical protein